MYFPPPTGVNLEFSSARARQFIKTVCIYLSGVRKLSPGVKQQDHAHFVSLKGTIRDGSQLEGSLPIRCFLLNGFPDTICDKAFFFVRTGNL